MEIITIVGAVYSEPIEIFTDCVKTDYVSVTVKCNTSKANPPSYYIVHVFSKKQMEFALNHIHIGDIMSVSGKIFRKETIKEYIEENIKILRTYIDVIINANYIGKI
jgi:hypothetical protein